MYDVANTVFNMGVVGLFIPLWINDTEGATDANLGFPVAISMSIVLIASPFLGALTDQSQARLKIFTFLNLVAVGATFFIGWGDHLFTSLVFFCIAFVSVYLAELLYNALLAQTTTESNRGKIGGIGIGLGYVGALGVILFSLQYDKLSTGYGLAFQVLAGAFLVTAAPMTVFFRDSQGFSGNTRHSVVRATVIQITNTFEHFRQFPRIPKFFFARYFYMIGVTTGSTFGVLYGLNTIGFTEREVELVMLLGGLVAIPSSILWGIIVDKIGPGKALKWVLVGWGMMFIGSVSIPWLHLDNNLWWGLSVLTGIFYGGLWVADRPLLIQLSPSKLGEMFGVYGAISRLASITGALTWPFIAVTLDLGQPWSVFFLLCCNVTGLAILILFDRTHQNRDDVIRSV